MQSNHLLTLLTAIGMLTLSSCTKQYQDLENDPDEIGQFCRIDSLVSGPGASINITYNAAGNPVDMMPTEDHLSPVGEWHFRYDKRGRLTDQLLTQPGQTFVFSWQRYFYPSPTIVGDSSFDYNGDLDDKNPPLNSLTGVGAFELDKKGRVIKEFSLPSSPVRSEDTVFLVYDKNDNLVETSDPAYMYDDKVNIYRTNKVWQFIYRNYSMNNQVRLAAGGFPPSITSYNKFGLPVDFDDMNPNVSSGPGVFILFYNTLTARYSCDSKPVPNIPAVY